MAAHLLMTAKSATVGKADRTLLESRMGRVSQDIIAMAKGHAETFETNGADVTFLVITGSLTVVDGQDTYRAPSGTYQRIVSDGYHLTANDDAVVLLTTVVDEV